MDLNELRLSEEEMKEAGITWSFGAAAIADVQLRKAVEGIADWLDCLESELFIPAHFGKYLRKAAGPRRGKVAKSGDRIRIKDGSLGMLRVCDGCGDVKEQRYKSPPYPHWCKKCNTVRAAREPWGR